MIEGPVRIAAGSVSSFDREVFRVGLLLRRQFRRMLQSEGIAFVEDKGLLNSQFTVAAPAKEVDFLRRLAIEWQEQAK